MRDKRAGLGQILTLARWETRRSIVLPGRKMLPAAIVLIIILAGATFLSAENGLHLEDGIFSAGTDDPELAALLASDPRFSVSLTEKNDLLKNRAAFDLTVTDRAVVVPGSEKSRAAAVALERDYEQYKNSLFSREEDLFAAYPLWIDVENVRSEVDFSSPGSSSRVITPQQQGASVLPRGPVEFVPPPGAGIGVSSEELRAEVKDTGTSSGSFFRYADFAAKNDAIPYLTPSRFTPPLPFDSIVLVFVFIFPLYFTSQFFMMSIMNERFERRGEALLSAPVRPSVIVSGKALPYFAGMIAISAGLVLFFRGPPALLLPLIPVILFFIASGLIIGMVSRSFKELSFISIFFSTVTTVYLFFPSIFADVHVISLVSPLTLMVYLFQGETFTAGQYLFSTSLFFITSAVLLYAGIVNFREERLFSQEGLTSKIINFISSGLSPNHPYLSLFALGMLVVPFVLMVQLMLLVLFFNLPMPLSLALLLVSAAAVEEIAKSLGLYTLATRNPGFLTWKSLGMGAVATASGFLVAEKLLLLVTISQIAESVFGTILFASLGLLSIPFLIHLGGILVTGTALKLRGSAAYLPGLILATLLHCAANLYLLRGWFW
jgi:ABC-type Na+ efflux pump permease subunit